MRPKRSNRPNWMRRSKLLSLAAFLFGFLPFVAGFGSAAHATPQSPVPQEYNPVSFTQELQRLKSGLDAAGKSAETLRAYREALPKAWPVNTGGHRFEVPTDALVSRLERAEKQPAARQKQLDQARAYLDSLAQETDSISAQSPSSTEAARPKLNAILARSEYKHERRESWYERIRNRIEDILSEALDRIFGKIGGEKSLGYALLWMGVAGAAILIAYWVFRNWFRSAKAAELALGMVSTPSLSWQEWIFGAREAAGRGDYRMAVHCAYWAGIARLQDVGALAPDRAKTPREYLRALAKSKLVPPEGIAARNQALGDLTARLEKTWYGYHAATEADFRDSLARLEALGCRLP
jgi:uncharacterized protein DUF4129